MRSTSMLFRAVPAVFIAALGFAAVPAHAESYQTRLTAFVPTSCSAGLSGTFGQLGADAFSLGNVDQYCNTRFQLSLSHDVLATGAQLSFGNEAVSLGQGSTVVKTLADPTANSSDQMVVYGVDEAAAQQFGASLTVTISPVAF